jgi:hypothetical protein
VRLRGRDPEFVVTAPPSDDVADDPDRILAGEPSPPRAAPRADTAPPAPSDMAEGGAARITLRLPEQLKARIEESAGRDGLSVNAWLVRAVAAAVEPTTPARPAMARSASAGQRYTGWSR